LNDPLDPSRRSWLARSIQTFGAFIVGVLGWTGGRYFTAPAYEKKTEEWTEIGYVDEFPAGTPLKVEVVRRERDGWMITRGRAAVWIYRKTDGAFVAYDPHCTHLGCPFRWDESSSQFLCPCHNGVYDREGRNVSGPPPRPLDRFPIKIVDQKVYILPLSVKGAA
jgi:menaquinol-cytochrome c reductase iron-sulfur subunit